MNSEFREIGHSGGQIIFRIFTDDTGKISYQISLTHSRPTPFIWIGIYALEQGIPVSTFKMGGIGQAWDPPPPRGCLPVFLASDSEGQFGHNCTQCEGYWRSGPWPKVCPYCGNLPEYHHTLSKAQIRYVQHYCEILNRALGEIENGEVTIDMDSVADAVNDPDNRPSFYVSEEKQQHQYNCVSCGEFNDILGSFAYCSTCGTRNDIEILKANLSEARDRLNAGGKPEDCLRDVVSNFDSFLGQTAKQLVSQIPMTKARKARLTRGRFHKYEEICGILQEWFDIHPTRGATNADVSFTNRMFLRRHVHEHNGGEVDQSYISESGDDSVRLKQSLRERPEDLHRLIGIINKTGQNIHAGFHDIFPPIDGPIKAHKERQERLRRR